MYFCFVFSFFCTLFSQVKSVWLRGECVRDRSLSQSAPAPVSVSLREYADTIYICQVCGGKAVL